MARKKEKEITCTAEYTEGCGERLTQALVDIYYKRKKYGTEENQSDKTA